LTLLGRIDFGEAVEKDSKKAKSGKEPAPATAAAWPWQGLVENLQQAHQELNIILDFITHVRR
jgi:mediator of RNA polymerase II transcription subunit 17